MIGRTTSVARQHCSTPLRQPHDDDSALRLRCVHTIWTACDQPMYTAQFANSSSGAYCMHCSERRTLYTVHCSRLQQLRSSRHCSSDVITLLTSETSLRQVRDSTISHSLSMNCNLYTKSSVLRLDLRPLEQSRKLLRLNKYCESFKIRH